MKDIDALLSKHTPNPKRPLRDAFTKTVIAEIKSGPQLPITAWDKVLAMFRHRLLTKAGIASLAGVVLVSGTVAAIALWPKPSVTPIVAKQLPSGNHIVGYDEQNCNYFDELHGGAIAPTNDKVYYEVRRGSSLTDQQLQADLQAMCETNLSDEEVSTIIKQNHLTIPGMMSTDDYIVQDISRESITVKLDPHYNRANLVATAGLPETYTHFASNLIVQNESNKATYSDLKVGDEITMVVQDTSGKSTETSRNYDPLAHPNTIKILAIVKVPPLTGDPLAFDTLVGTTLVRVDKCTTSPTGFCRAYNFVN